MLWFYDSMMGSEAAEALRVVWMWACCKPAILGANHGFEGLLNHIIYGEDYFR